MLYFSPPTGSKHVHDAMFNGELGFISTPDQGNALFNGVDWCADNGCFSPTRAKKGIAWDEEKWWEHLVNHAAFADRCWFATAPDVVHWIDGEPVGDAEATLAKSEPWYAQIRRLGYPVALVAQDGLRGEDVPWDSIDTLFIGGSDDFKIGPMRLRMDGTPKGPVPCGPLVREAHTRGKRVHYGRVNSRMRYRFGVKLRCHSADGTFLRFGPDKRLPELLSWVRPMHGKNLTLNGD